LDGMEYTVEVDVDHLRPLRARHLRELLEALYPRRVDKHQDRAELLPSRRAGGDDLRAVGYIGDVTELVVGRRQVDDGRLKSVAAQPLGDGATNPRGGARYDCGLQARYRPSLATFLSDCPN